MSTQQNLVNHTKKLWYNFDTVPCITPITLVCYDIFIVTLSSQNAVKIEMFLRAIYQPHNVYCTNVDKSCNANETYYKLLPKEVIASNLEYFIYKENYRLNK